jgi:hypothetical protein
VLRLGRRSPLFVRTKQNLSPAGVLPVAIGVPIVVGLALFGQVFLRPRTFAT